MHGTRFAQFSTEVLRRGAAAVLPQHLPDHWLDALLEEAELLAPEAWDPQDDARVQECCAGLLGAVLVVLMEQRGHPDQLEVAVGTLMRHLHLSLSRLNYPWPECEVQPEMMEDVAARHLCVQRGLNGGNEARQLVHSHTDESQERGRAGLQASARSTSQRGGRRGKEASWTVNRDKLNYHTFDIRQRCMCHPWSG